MLTIDHGAPVVTDDATREEILEALRMCSATAGRTLSRDNLGRLNHEWTVRHRFLNRLLDMLDQCDSP